MKHPQWKVALWARDSIEPAMLRVPIVITVFVALWGINLWMLDRLRMPYHFVLSIKSASLSFIFGAALAMIIFYAVNMTFFTSGLGWTIEHGIIWFYVIAVLVYILPYIYTVSNPKAGTNTSIYPTFMEEHKTTFNRLLRTVFFPGSTITFPEVLLADAMTSVSKVLKDFGTTLVAVYAIITKNNVIDLHDSAMILVALLASLPFWIRVRQCSVQLDSCPDFIAKIPVYLNIIKYCTAFPPIWLTAAASLGYQHPRMAEFITYAAVFNSLYSFAWDTIMDWGLLTIHRDGRITRRSRLYYPTITYVLALVINLALRFSWTINRIPGMNHIHSSIIVLIIEIGEVFRRAMWNLYRIEWEIIVQQEKFQSSKEKAHHLDRDSVGMSGHGSSNSLFNDSRDIYDEIYKGSDRDISGIVTADSNSSGIGSGGLGAGLGGEDSGISMVLLDSKKDKALKQ